MVEVVYQDLSNKDSQNYYIGIPRDWKYGKDDDVTVIVSDVCVVIPQTYCWCNRRVESFKNS